MAYTKTNWVNGYTPLNASNMNKIEEGIFSNDTFLSSLDIRVNTLEGSIGQGGIGSVVVNGNGNALNNASYDPSTKILNFEKNNTFALDSDLDSVNDKNLYHLGAYDSVNGNVITRQTGYRNVSKWFLQNTGNLTFRSTAVGYQIGKDGGNGLLSNPYIVDTLTTGIANKDFVFADDNASYGNTSNYILNPNWISLPNTFTTKQSYIDYFSKNEIIIQYKLASSYTEEIIDGQPLTTLDQSGSQWVRSEWEKGLNLLNENVRKINNWVIILGNVNLKAGVVYNLWTDVTFPNGQKAVLKDSNDRVIAFSGYTFGGNNYFTVSSDYNGQISLSGTFPDVNPTKAMLNEGSHAYPYQEYRGGIAREDQLVLLKTFSASNSTMNDVLDYIHENYDHIISIIYYAKSGGEAFGRSVIYNADEGILAYITSGLTFANVELNTDAEEGSDYIYIYYNKY